MNEPDDETVPCAVCGKAFARNDVLPATMVRPAIAALIRRESSSWGEGGYLCFDDLNRFRTELVRDILETERGELTQLDAQVLESLQQQDLLSRNADLDFDEQATIGQRVADRVAEFGGSWRFIILFCVLMLLWIIANSLLWLFRPWDPYPFILLNLMLSCLAALQAPVIMMSQNRQEDRDRLRAENDYKINLKAELEIRNLHAKLDLLLSHQWQRLLEIQEIQVEMMEELVARERKPDAAPSTATPLSNPNPE